MQDIFTNIYRTCHWGDNNHEHYKGSSGGGSSVEFNDTYIPFVKEFIKKNDIQTVVDLGCGDFRCGSALYDDLDITYTGIDVYTEMVEYLQSQYPSDKYRFVISDFSRDYDMIPGGDLCILKDVLQHWSNKYIYEFLDYLVHKKLFKHILLVNCCEQLYDNQDIVTGDTRQLSSDMLPLKKYSPVVLMRYHTKQVVLISP